MAAWVVPRPVHRLVVWLWLSVVLRMACPALLVRSLLLVLALLVLVRLLLLVHELLLVVLLLLLVHKLLLVLHVHLLLLHEPHLVRVGHRFATGTTRCRHPHARDMPCPSPTLQRRLEERGRSATPLSKRARHAWWCRWRRAPTGHVAVRWRHRRVGRHRNPTPGCVAGSVPADARSSSAARRAWRVVRAARLGHAHEAPVVGGT